MPGPVLKQADLLTRVRSTLEQYQLISPGAAVLAGVSGGVDSVFLLHVLSALRKDMGFTLRVAQFDHKLRAESGEEQQFVRQQCALLQVECICGSGDVAGYAQEKNVSLEVAARELRYAFFRQTLRPGERLALAHHMDDQAETVLLRLLRGTGRQGLAAMRIQNGEIIRPLLGIRRSEIEQWCIQRQILWREDASNQDVLIPRNRVRRELLPYLQKEFNPSVVPTLARTAALMAEDEDLLQCLTQEAARHISRMGTEALLKLEHFEGLHIALQKRLVRRLAASAGMQRDLQAVHVEAALGLLQAETGSSVDIGWGYAAVRDADALCIYKTEEPEPFCVPLQVPGVTVTPLGTFTCAFRAPEKPLKEYTGNTRYLSAQALQGACVRTRQPGDVIAPLGTAGSRKLKEYFIDIKLPRRRRNRTPLLCRENRVLWVAGFALDKQAAIAQNDRHAVEVVYSPPQKEIEDEYI